MPHFFDPQQLPSAPDALEFLQCFVAHTSPQSANSVSPEQWGAIYAATLDNEALVTLPGAIGSIILQRGGYDWQYEQGWKLDRKGVTALYRADGLVYVRVKSGLLGGSSAKIMMPDQSPNNVGVYLRRFQDQESENFFSMKQGDVPKVARFAGTVVTKFLEAAGLPLSGDN